MVVAFGAFSAQYFVRRVAFIYFRPIVVDAVSVPGAHLLNWGPPGVPVMVQAVGAVFAYHFFVIRFFSHFLEVVDVLLGVATRARVGPGP